MKRDMEMIRQILIDMEAHEKIDDVLRLAILTLHIKYL